MSSPSRPESPPDSAARTRPVLHYVLYAILAFQILMPLRYYLGGRGYDERFSWRMFSTLRMRDCKVRVTEQVRAQGRVTPREVTIDRDVHVAWVRLLERMRGPVIDAYLARRCELGDSTVERVDFACDCRDTTGEALPTQARSLDCEQARAQLRAAP